MPNRRTGRGSLEKKKNNFAVKKNAEIGLILEVAAYMRLGFELCDIRDSHIVNESVKNGTYNSLFSAYLDKYTLEKYRSMVNEDLNRAVTMNVVFATEYFIDENTYEVEDFEPEEIPTSYATVNPGPSDNEPSDFNGPDIVPEEVVDLVTTLEPEPLTILSPMVQEFVNIERDVSIYYEEKSSDGLGTYIEKCEKTVRLYSVKGVERLRTSGPVLHYQLLQSAPMYYLRRYGTKSFTKRILELILNVLPVLPWDERHRTMRRLLFLQNCFLPPKIKENSLSDLALRSYLQTRISMLQELIWWSCSDNGIRPELTGWRKLEELATTSLVHYERMLSSG